MSNYKIKKNTPLHWWHSNETISSSRFFEITGRKWRWLKSLIPAPLPPPNWEPMVPWLDIFERPDWLTILYKLWKLNRGQTIYLWSKVVLFCSFCQVEIFQTTPASSCRTVLISLESSWWVGGVHRLYGVEWKLLLIIEPFFH